MTAPRSTIEETRAIASGDTEAFARFYDTWFTWVLAEARRATSRDEAFCLDVVQDVMLDVVKRLPPLANEAIVCSWLKRTIRSRAIDRLRSEQRRRRRESAVATSTVTTDPDTDTRIAWLHEQLDELGHDVRDLLRMRHGLGWSLARIGGALGLRTGAVDRRLRTAIDELRRRAVQELPDE